MDQTVIFFNTDNIDINNKLRKYLNTLDRIIVYFDDNEIVAKKNSRNLD